ncbi:uncharacterized protein LOC102806813 [Saccoglossus kowalevskii]|uniref:Uncharacterized protein LOC102806813 n=1 Tax=Saccoglossus kowalevskii TaxID=10224 RepID=A0ABM0M1Q9_SACKO|nr:PREDICTED: uncharacterized protein LOC102806813 [Saccoglossus kowalevskii]
MQWNVENDELGFQDGIKESSSTRRGVLRMVSSVHDPLGLAAPAVLPAKIILQNLSRDKLDWEEEISNKQYASESGYGTVTYIRMVNQKNEVNCALLSGKARVLPLKTITIPHMELTAATVSICINRLLKRELDLPITESYYWTDSQTVLRYINNKTARFHAFVANRISVIHKGSEPRQWSYVSTNDNPADKCSRGQPIEEQAMAQRPRVLTENKAGMAK